MTKVAPRKMTTRELHAIKDHSRGERYTKTKIWKAEQVLEILQEVSQPDLWTRLPQPTITELLVIDDNSDNLQEIAQEVGRWIMSNKEMRAHYFLSLQEATANLTRF